MREGRKGQRRCGRADCRRRPAGWCGPDPCPQPAFQRIGRVGRAGALTIAAGTSRCLRRARNRIRGSARAGAPAVACGHPSTSTGISGLVPFLSGPAHHRLPPGQQARDGAGDGRRPLPGQGRLSVDPGAVQLESRDHPPPRGALHPRPVVGAQAVATARAVQLALRRAVPQRRLHPRQRLHPERGLGRSAAARAQFVAFAPRERRRPGPRLDLQAIAAAGQRRAAPPAAVQRLLGGGRGARIDVGQARAVQRPGLGEGQRGLVGPELPEPRVAGVEPAAHEAEQRQLLQEAGVGLRGGVRASHGLQRRRVVQAGAGHQVGHRDLVGESGRVGAGVRGCTNTKVSRAAQQRVGPSWLPYATRLDNKKRQAQRSPPPLPFHASHRGTARDALGAAHEHTPAPLHRALDEGGGVGEEGQQICCGGILQVQPQAAAGDQAQVILRAVQSGLVGEGDTW